MATHVLGPDASVHKNLRGEEGNEVDDGRSDPAS